MKEDKIDKLVEKEKTSHTMKIKKICSLCGSKFKNNWQLYKLKGNLCQKCNTRCSSVVTNKITTHEADISLEIDRAKVEKREVNIRKLEELSFEALPIVRKELDEIKEQSREQKQKIKVLKEQLSKLNLC
jgi:hypothetical protein